MSSSKSEQPRFLIDENVRKELYDFVRKNRLDVVRSPKSTVNGELAARSVDESRILVTNDRDFSNCAAGTVFGVVWLRLPQNDPDLLLKSFTPLLRWPAERFKDNLIVLSMDACEVFPLAVEL